MAEEKKPEPMTRMARKDDRLYTERKGDRIVFLDSREPETTVALTIGTRMEFFRPLKAGPLDVNNKLLRCTLRLVWVSSITGEHKSALEFEHCLVYLDQVYTRQEVYIQEVP